MFQVFFFLILCFSSHSLLAVQPCRGSIYNITKSDSSQYVKISYSPIDNQENSGLIDVIVTQLGPEIHLKKEMNVYFELDSLHNVHTIFWDVRKPLLPISKDHSLQTLYTQNPPMIDGIFDDFCWGESPQTTPFQDIEGINQPHLKPKYPTIVKSCWDSKYLYFSVTLNEPHICAHLTTRDTVVFFDNDFELFLDPDRDCHAYAEIEINALNTVWDLLLTKPYKDQGLAMTSWNIQGLKTAVKCEGSLNNACDIDTAWQIEMAIPFASLGACGVNKSPEFDTVWNVNFSRVQWQYTINKNNEYEKIPNIPESNWVWSPTGIIAIHHPERWGNLYFVDTLKSDSPPIEPIVSELYDLYYAQVAHYQNVGYYVDDLVKLVRIFNLPNSILSRKYTLEQTPQGWRISITNPITKLTYRIIQDGRLEYLPNL